MHVDSLFGTSDHHPVMLTPGADASAEGLRAYLSTCREDVEKLLLRHGGILFRGFHLAGPDDVRLCAESAGGRPLHYIGGNSPRSRVAQDVFTSTEFPASEVIGLHNEMSYLPEWPRRVFFYSLVPAREGGQTPLAHSGDVLAALPAEIVRKVRDKKLDYIRHFQSHMRVGKSWQDAYQTHDRGEAERIIEEQGSTYAWLPGDVLRVSIRCEGIMSHPVTQEEVWFNQAELWHPSALSPAMRTMYEELVGKDHMPRNCEYGDGEPLEEALLVEVREVLRRNKLVFDWQQHDLLILDNVLMMHGRESFKGDRKTLAYLSAT